MKDMAVDHSTFEALSRFLGLPKQAGEVDTLVFALGEQAQLFADIDRHADLEGLTGEDLTRATAALVWDPRWR